MDFFSVPGLDQSKQATDEAKSPCTCHNPRSSRSLLALSMWVPIVLTHWKTALDLQRRTRSFFFLPLRHSTQNSSLAVTHTK